MSKTKLFEAWTFKLALPEPFDDPQYSGAKDFGLSQYNQTGRVRKATLHAPTLRALLAYAKLQSASEQGQSTEHLGAIGHQDANFKISEYESANKTDCVVFSPITGKFIASQFQSGSDHPNPYSLGSGKQSGSALFFCLMPVLEGELEFQQKFAEFKADMEADWPDMAKSFDTALTLCDNVYRRIEAAQVLGDAGLKTAIPATGNIASLTPMALSAGNYNPSGSLYGTFAILQAGAHTASPTTAFTHDSFVAHYPLSARTLSNRENAMVPNLPDWYIIPREVVRVCEHAKLTTGGSQPMRNFLFRGVAGTGKTMGAQAIAAGLGLPYTLMTCSANTEISDLVGQFIPDSEGARKGSSISEGAELPKFSDISMDPASVFAMLTGDYDETKSEDDVMQALIEAAVAKLAVKEEYAGQQIRYVDTPLMEAIRYGYLCELQEPSCIANPGVLVGLNSLLDNCQTITLPTGETVKRHPDTVIVVTTNSDYSGCREVNQSVISRMDLIYDIEAPDLDTMVRRVMNVTGYTNEEEATKMALVVQAIAERCHQTMITDGSCGMREYKAWVQSTMITNDPYESALSTIIASASADADNRAELISTCLEAQYTRTI